MEISRVNIYPCNGEKVKANGNIGFDDAFVVNFKIMEGKNGLFVSFPMHSYEDKDGTIQYVNDFYFLEKDFREFVTEGILKVYYDEVDGATKKNKPSSKSSISRFKRK